MSIRKPTVEIYVNPKAKSTDVLTDFIAKHIDRINENLMVKIIRVTSKNVNLVKKRGIKRTPTLLYDNKPYESLEKIVRILTPPGDEGEHYGYGNTTPDDLTHQYHESVLSTGDDDGSEDAPEKRAEVIRQRMAALQKRRPEMRGVDKTRSVKGGRKVIATSKRSAYDTDDDFRRASGVDDVDETPIKKFMEEDGESILEDYYNDEADKFGRKLPKVISKRR